MISVKIYGYAIQSGWLLMFLVAFLSNPGFSRDSHARITLLTGRVEIIRAESLNWKMAKAGEILGNNDKILVHDRAKVEGEFDDGTHFRLHEKTKLLFNVSRATELGNSHKIFTLYSGAMYLNTKKPFEKYEGHYSKVFLGPLSVVTHEGALVLQNPSHKRDPRIGILSGTSKVFNSNGPQEMFFQDGQELRLDTSGTLMEPEEIDAEYYFKRYPWVSYHILDKDLSRGKLLRKRNQDIISGTRLGRVIITEFDFQGEDLINWEVGRYFTTLVAGEFSEVSYREFLMVGKSEKHPSELAEEYEADRIVKGSVEKLHFDKKAVLNSDSTKYELRMEVTFSLKVQIFDESGKNLIKNAVFKGSLMGKKEEAGRLKEFLDKPLNGENQIMQAVTFVKIIGSLKKKLRKFARSAV